MSFRLPARVQRIEQLAKEAEIIAYWDHIYDEDGVPYAVVNELRAAP